LRSQTPNACQKLQIFCTLRCCLKPALRLCTISVSDASNQ
jgi:hypothetical protein